MTNKRQCLHITFREKQALVSFIETYGYSAASKASGMTVGSLYHVMWSIKHDPNKARKMSVARSNHHIQRRLANYLNEQECRPLPSMSGRMISRQFVLPKTSRDPAQNDVLDKWMQIARASLLLVIVVTAGILMVVR